MPGGVIWASIAAMTAPSKTPGFHPYWVGRGPTAGPGALTCVRSSDSLIARVCVSKKLSLER